MKNWKSTVAILSICTLLSIGGGPLAADAAATGTLSAPTTVVTRTIAGPTDQGPLHIGVIRSSFLWGDVHEQMYLTYLVKEYAPESLAAWQEAFAQRNQVMNELQKTAPAPKNIDDKTVRTYTFGELSAVTSIDAKTLDNAEIQSVPALEFVVKAAPIDPVLQAEMEAQAELTTGFTQAVEAKDGQKITSLLPKLLENYIKTTNKLSEQKIAG